MCLLGWAFSACALPLPREETLPRSCCPRGNAADLSLIHMKSRAQVDTQLKSSLAQLAQRRVGEE